MAPPNPKNPSRPRHPAVKSPTQQRTRPRYPTEEMPFDDGPILDADDPRPQHVPQYPTEVRRPPARRAAEEEALPTTVYEISQDEELPPTYDPRELSDSGYKPAFLYVEKGPGQGQLVPVKQGTLVIGRASVSELRLQHPSVSRRHAQVTRLGERFYLKDLGSQNATFVNKVKIETEIEIYPGDTLQIGQAVLKLRGPAEKLPEQAKKQIAKAEARSAKRKPATASTAVAKRASGGSNKLLLGIACAAIGFGLSAVLLFVVMNVNGRQPTFEELPAGTQAAVAQPLGAAQLPVEANEPAVEADPVQVRIEREMAKKAAAAPTPEPEQVQEPERRVEAPSPAPRPERSASSVARRTETRKVAAVSRPEPKREPAASSAPSNAEILKLYEAGKVTDAISAAKDSGDNELASRLTEFNSAYQAAQKAERAGDGSGAISNYEKALAVDERLSGGWGKHGPVISKKLGQLYTLVGQYYLKDDDSKNAELAFKKALKYDPRNKIAKSHLAKAEAAPAAKPAAKSAIEDAWSDEEAPAPAPAKKKATRAAARSAIEDAWED